MYKETQMKACVLLSGGLDSTTTLAEAVHTWGASDVLALSMYYGQRHDKELEAGRKIAEYYGVKRIVLDLSEVFKASNSAMLKSGVDVPEESYEDQLKHDKQPATVVPFRNGVFLAVAASVAQAHGCVYIYAGVHSGDAGSNYWDCRTDFVEALNKAVYIGTGNEDGVSVRINTPFVGVTKDSIVQRALELKAPLKYTWSCYKGGSEPCGVCGTCVERREAFSKAGAVDPAIEYYHDHHNQPELF